LFPELNLGGTTATASTAAEEVEKPDEETSTATPGAAGITPIEDDTIPGSELDAYKISGSLSYAAPFNLQIGATGPQGRGSRLGYSGAVTKAEPSSATGLSQSAASVALPKFDYSPFESLLAKGESILSNIQSAAQSMVPHKLVHSSKKKKETHLIRLIRLIRLVLSPSQQVQAQHLLGPEDPATLTQPSVKQPVV
jgi:hypothetical protein